jgi:hypothetical protein
MDAILATASLTASCSSLLRSRHQKQKKLDEMRPLRINSFFETSTAKGKKDFLLTLPQIGSPLFLGMELSVH